MDPYTAWKARPPAPAHNKASRALPASTPSSVKLEKPNREPTCVLQRKLYHQPKASTHRDTRKPNGSKVWLALGANLIMCTKEKGTSRLQGPEPQASQKTTRLENPEDL